MAAEPVAFEELLLYAESVERSVEREARSVSASARFFASAFLASALRTASALAFLAVSAAFLAAASSWACNSCSRAICCVDSADCATASERPAVMTGLREAGVDVLSLANNHTGDFQTEALLDTVQRVRAGGIQPVGAGRNVSEAIKPVIVSRSGLRFGFLAFNAIGETPRATSTSPGAFSVRMPPRTGPLNQSDLAALTSAVGALRTAVDVVVVLPHWGQQYTHNPVAAQRTVADALTEAGADLVIGGHPHWVQSVQYLPNKLVAHSLGNLVFDMDFSQQTQEGVLLEVTYWGKTLKAARLTPYVIDDEFTPRIVTGNRGDQILRDIRNAG